MQFPRSTHPYIWTDEGWLYLAMVLDLFNREVIGWSIKPRMTDLFDYIEAFYNRKRRHSTLGYVSPVQFMINWFNSQHIQKWAA